MLERASGAPYSGAMHSTPLAPTRWQRLSVAFMHSFHAYGSWLVGISWRRFAVLALLLIILANMLQNIPPFSWRFTEIISVDDGKPPAGARRHGRDPAVLIEKPARPEKTDKADKAGKDNALSITIDDRGIRITPITRAASATAGATANVTATATATAPAEAASPQAPGGASASNADAAAAPSVEIRLPPGADSSAVREAVQEAREAIVEAIRDGDDARREAARDAMQDDSSATGDPHGPRVRTHQIHLGDFLPQLALLWITASAILKITYKGRLQAEVQAAQAQVVAEKATETAEAESLKRQVVEARMAAMQAQVEPHFLFNTLASIDHLIETDPPRASRMQKNLIALLRASMPTLREASDGGVRDLGRELEMVRPYVEILKVRMEERLDSRIDVPDGLLSAEFPPMMMQTLVENAIRHGLEPQPDGGRLEVKAEVVHGRLIVTVADTGVGLPKVDASAGAGDSPGMASGTAPGTATGAAPGRPASGGVGLANIRERLALLYGDKARLQVGDNPGGGTLVMISLPYRPVAEGQP
jgi:signal transduction histidine kinase